MTEKEREFKIKKIQKYNKEIEKVSLSFPIIWGGFSILLVAYGVVHMNQNPNDLLSTLLGLFVSFGGGLNTMSNIETIVDEVAKRANLKSEVERLKEEIKIDMLNNPEKYNNEEERGHSRWK